MPVASAGRRPHRLASAASGTAVSAVPSVIAAVARPDNASLPDRCAASTAPSETVAPKLIPPST